MIGFFTAYRQLYPVSRDTLRGIADGFQQCLKSWSSKRNVPILDAPKGRRDEFVEPYFKGAEPDTVVVVLKAREPARIMTAIGDKAANRRHLQFDERWVGSIQLLCQRRPLEPHVRAHVPLPAVFGADLPQPASSARQPPARGGHRLPAMRQCLNRLRRPRRLQELADELSPRDLVSCGQKWLACFTPFFTPAEREEADCRHGLFFTQTEYYDNLVFHRRTALDRLGERLLNANRTIGQPDKLTTIFGHKITKTYRGKLQTETENMHLPNPVIRSNYRNGFMYATISSCAPRPPPTTSPTTASAKRLTTCRRCARRSRPSTIITSTSSISSRPSLIAGNCKSRRSR